jgi:hypothetical protein
MSDIPPKFEEAINKNGEPLHRYTVTPHTGVSAAPQFPTNALPKTVEMLVTEAAAAIGCPPDAIGLAALTTLGSAIGNSRIIQLKKGWKEGAAIYAAVIADSGEKKTAAIGVATDPALRLQNRLNKDHEKALEEHATEMREYEVEKKQAAKDNLAAPAPPEKPTAERNHVNDTTVEALIPILKQDPRGVLQERDELVAFTKAMDQYKSGGKGADRQFYLSAFSNRPVSVDRKGQPEPLSVLRPFVSVLGSIQPSVLPELAENREDGMLERFLFVYPEPINSMWTDDEISDAATVSYSDLYGRLRRNLSIDLDDLGDPIEKTVEFSHEAKKLFVSQYNVHRTEMGMPGFPSSLRSPWAKLEGYFARIILILACCRIVENGDPERVEEEDVLKAWYLVQYFKDQARRVFSALRGFDPHSKLVEDVSKFVGEKGGSWSGTATELHELLDSDFKPERPDELSKFIQSATDDEPGLSCESETERFKDAEGEWKSRRVLWLTLRNGVTV